jgi:SAM-dependent methyltransferase
MGWVTRNMPAPVVSAVRSALRVVTGEPQVGSIDFGALRRTRPISRDWGESRGGAVDRRYIADFLAAHAADIRGRVLEIGDDTYARQYGGTRVDRMDILHWTAGNPKATVVADLADAPHIEDDTFDCAVITQTLQYIYRPEAAIATLHRILRPGGVLLLTVPGITQLSMRCDWSSNWYWSFALPSVRRLLADRFGAGAVACSSAGNVLAALAHLHGIAASELTDAELADRDPDYQVIITARAVKQRGVGP